MKKGDKLVVDKLIDKQMSYFDSGIDDKYDEPSLCEQIYEYGNIFENLFEINFYLNCNMSGLQVESIINSLVSGYYQIPGFQRRFVWTKKQITYLALSIIKNIPIPPIYLYLEKELKRHVVLDGQQRITAIFLYFLGLYFISENNRKKLDFKDIYNIKLKLTQIDKDIENLNEEMVSCEKRKEMTRIKQEIKELKNNRKKGALELKERYGLEETEYEYTDSNNNKINISIEEFDENSKEFLLRKRIEIAVVQCNDKYPQKVYAHIFKLLNSGGKLLGTQEIRNGVYWNTILYKNLFDINEDNIIWRKIYGKISIFSKDVEILLKALSLQYYTVCENEQIKIEYGGTFSWFNIMDDFSEECLSFSKIEVEKHTDLLKSFFNIIIIDDERIKCKKAVFEAVFVAFCKHDLLDREGITIDYSWMCSLNKDDAFDKVLSNKTSIESRLLRAYQLVEEKYIE